MTGKRGKTPPRERLMRDSSSTEAERPLQHEFSKSAVGRALLLFAAVLIGDEAMRWVPDREPRPDSAAALHFAPVSLDTSGLGPLRLAGAWSVESADSRFGGISSLASDGEALIALTDSGVVVRFRPPGASGSGRAEFHDLPSGPVSAYYKMYRDTEALLARPDGRGWWVTFENRHSLWSYDPTFRWVRSHRPLPGEKWHHNRGVEAMADGEGALLLLPESGRIVLRPEQSGFAELPLDNRLGAPADAKRLPDGRILLAMRRFGLAGFRNRLALLERSGDGYRTVPLAELPLGTFDNVEGLAVQPLGAGATRLWLMTDNDFNSWRRTLLIAFDLPPGR